MPANWQEASRLTQAAATYFDYRAALLLQFEIGLTELYARFHDPEEEHADLMELRELHDAMDRAVLDAYGWTDIRPTCEFILDYEDEEDDTPGKANKRKKPWRCRWPDDIRDEVLGRLLELNAQRAKEEALASAAATAGKPKVAAQKKGVRRPKGTPLLER